MPMTLPYTTILFDLDGTLTDPKEGITKAVQFALKQLGIKVDDLNTLTPFIGPPLRESFKMYYRLSDKKIEKAVTHYRTYFEEKGMYENLLFDEVTALLKRLSDANYKIALATSKPTVYAAKILQHFNIDTYFDVIVGSELDGTRSKKGEVIAEVLEQLHIESLENCIMIGDKEQDILGARENGIDSIGVTYGYGSQKELELAEATYIVHTVNSFSIIFGNRAQLAM